MNNNKIKIPGSKILNDILTGKDCKTFDIGRVSWLIALFAVVGYATYQLYNHSGFSLREFGETIGIITGAHGAAVWAKKETEPDLLTSSKNTEEPENK
jgi:uncharacterized membrane protein